MPQAKYILLLILIITCMYLFNDNLTHTTKLHEIPFHIPRKNTSGPDKVFGVPLTIYHSWSSNRVPAKMKENIYIMMTSLLNLVKIDIE